MAPIIRSFFSPLWAVLGDVGGHIQQRGKGGQIGSDPLVHVVRFKSAVLWMRAFLRRLVGGGELSRTVDAVVGHSPPSVRFTCDASPWGLGAVLEISGRITAWLSDEFCSLDRARVDIVVGSCRSQAVVEALAGLVALRAWLPTWGQHRTASSVRPDSQAALGALGKLSSPARAINAVAREVAIDGAACRYGGDVWTHIAGVDNFLADALPRLSEPASAGASRAIPAELTLIARTPCDRRDESWWEAWNPP
jgi:hypothetical protein